MMLLALLEHWSSHSNTAKLLAGALVCPMYLELTCSEDVIGLTVHADTYCVLCSRQEPSSAQGIVRPLAWH